MYSDLFDQLGGGGGPRGRGGEAGSGNANSSSTTNDGSTILTSIKAGKMNLRRKEEPAAENKKAFVCEADTTRGEIRLVWTKENELQWQWYNRRDKMIDDSDTVVLKSAAASTPQQQGTFCRIELKGKQHLHDRIYVWDRTASTTSQKKKQKKEKQNGDEKENNLYKMYWMQDISTEKEEEIIATINQYLADPQSAAPATATSTTTTAARGGVSVMDIDGGGRLGLSTAAGTLGSGVSASAIHNGGGTTTTAGHSLNSTGGASTSSNQSQVDALSTILENLGMPQTGSDVSSSDGITGTNNTTTRTTSTSTGARATLTLADLQGAMASVQQQQQQASAAAAGSGPPLTEVITPAAISTLLENNDICQRLIDLLPEEQRSKQHLESNLRSPQVQQTLRSLTLALQADDAGNLDGFYSVLANFQLDPADGQAALVLHNNPIQAFLDCLLKKVQREEQQEGTPETNTTTNDNNDDAAGAGGSEESKTE